MKYKIYKTSSNLNGLRWWRNYDTAHRNLPDIDIETYLANKSITWSELKNTKNEPIKYETISKDSFDIIELNLPNLDEVPDYIKIEFELTDSKKECLYYYIDTVPSLFNAINRLNATVRYVLDKYVGFYKFHAYLKQNTINPQMFFVQKHHPRMFTNTNNKLVYDYNQQPWYMDYKQELPLYVRENKVFNNSELVRHSGYYDDLYIDEDGFIHKVNGARCTIAYTYAYGGVDNASHPTDFSPDITFLDNIFNRVETRYEYIVTKPKLKQYGSTTDVKLEKEFLIWPIAKENSYDGVIGYGNTIDNLYKAFPLIFNDSNIIGRFVVNIPPSVFARSYINSGIIGRTAIDLRNGCFVYDTNTNNDNYFKYLTFISDGTNISMKTLQNELLFTNKLYKIYDNFNRLGNYNKSKDNNPHLYAPQYWSLVHKTSTNDVLTLTADYMNTAIDTHEIGFDPDVPFSVIWGFIPSTYFYTVIESFRYMLSYTKDISSSHNELAVNELRQAPIQCDAFNNTWLQKQALDTSRNATVTSNVTALTLGTFSTILGAILSATGVGAPIGAGAIIGGVGSLIKGGVSLVNGLAQNTQAQKNLYNQANSLNNPIGISGLMTGDYYFTIYTKGLSDSDTNVINAEDNMYGYKITQWLPYDNYLTCWDGNYMLCDMTKNYNNIFTILKGIDSIWTKSDMYINQFIEALNNGITWFDNGNYIDLATDDYNWERTFPRHV